jgi:CHAD domain-containing protein
LTFVNRLKSLQDCLGHANDVRVANDLLDELLNDRSRYSCNRPRWRHRARLA